MTAVRKWMSVWRRFHWQWNPVVVKELRQAVRSWIVTGILLLFLGVLLITMLVYLAEQSAEVSPYQGIGQGIFQVLVAILASASLVFIPAYTGVRLALERREVNLDLLYITTLSPGRIIRGKLLCGIYLAVLLFSACMPFIVLTNMLRGVDLATISIVLILIFACVCGAVQIAIFLACLPMSLAFKSLLALAFIGAMIALTVGVSALAWEMMRGRGAFGGSMAVWLTLGFAYGIGFIGLYLCSAALISPRSMNRALPLRLYATALWLLTGLLITAWCYHYHRAFEFQIWLVFSVLLLGLGLVITIGSADELSMRVRRTIPVAWWKRFPAFFFYNGAAAGLAWLISLTLLTALAAWAIYYWDLTCRATGSGASYYSGIETEVFILLGIYCLYGYAYGLTSLFIHRTFFAHRPPLFASMGAFAIPMLWFFVPYLILFLWNRLSWQSMENRHLGNVFNVVLKDDPDFRLAHLWFAAVWAVLALVANGPWFVRCLRAFKPLPRHPQPPPT